MNEIETDKEFVKHCKQATESLTFITNRLDEDDELTGLETMSFTLALLSVNGLGKQLNGSQKSTASEYKWDDDHTFK